jgi:hypothetical protein
MIITLRAALLGCALVLVGALQDQSRFGSGNFAVYAQPPSLTDYKVTCKKIAESISSKSQVFYPGEPRVVGL